MRINTFFYTFKQGIRSIFKNKWYSLASVATIGACLFLFGVFFAIVVTHSKEIVNEMKKRVITMKKGVIISDEVGGGYIDED